MGARRVTLGVATVLLLVRTAGAVTWPVCPSARYDVYGAPLVGAGADGSDALFVAGTTFSTANACGPVDGKVRGTRKGTKITVKWLACGAIPGPHRLTALIDAASACQTITGTLRSKGVRGRRLFSGLRAVPVSCVTADQQTFDVIQKRIFSGRGCNVSTCHGAFAQAGLDLRDGASYGAIVGVPATNATAAAAGKLLVAPGDAASSFLAQKVHGTLAAGEGGQMPLVGGYLPQIELDLLDAWIAAGAPQTGIVAGAPCLPALQYQPAAPLPPPPGGYQLVLNGPTLLPGQEQEGCYWVPVPNGSDFTIGKWEYSLNPGTHHFAVYPNRVASPPLDQWLVNDFGCFQEATYGASLSGAPQSGYYVDAYPPGDARIIHAGTYLGLNAHYHNDFDVPIQIKVWVNLDPYKGTPQHLLQTLTSLDTTFGIDVAPFTTGTRHGHFVNALGVPMSFVNLSGHMHKRGLKFTIWRSDGTKVYENFDWAHPLGVLFDPPLVVAPGDWLDYECLFDNGITRPVKKDGLGNPIDVKFGVTTDDEMCILPGVYFTD